METANIFSENGSQLAVNGLFYVFNSKYYFMYTQGEAFDDEYIQLYIVQVCKEVKNTPNGPIDTGYMLGLEISNPDEWSNVQKSITKIVESRKNGTPSAEIQYLQNSMLQNLKIVSKNKFKLMRHVLEQNFNVSLSSSTKPNEEITNNQQLSVSNEPDNLSSDDVIIDYRAKYFEEQDKNSALEEQIKSLQEKLEAVKGILN